jgi:hypothetical protein
MKLFDKWKLVRCPNCTLFHRGEFFIDPSLRAFCGTSCYDEWRRKEKRRAWFDGNPHTTYSAFSS